ncbi:diaminopimelate epimerase [Synechococcus sp. CC9616]|uniref:diaminopimelate epimerase n=1 Tax=Synechococcus sp. CC9616 TaxID=110663 RepID=UPI00048C9176|nr:diaminopimelate epimerase [Synechococcus sp. CC9616]
MLHFSKYQGLGNDFLIVEGRSGQLPSSITQPDSDWVRLICDRRFGVGADGLILALPAEGEVDLRMRILNADGSEAEMCGNGIRCLARYLADSDGNPPGTIWSIETLAGVIRPQLQSDGQLCVDMGPPFLQPGDIPTTLEMGPRGCPQGAAVVGDDELEIAAVGMGNPHVVVPVQDLQSIPFDRWGHELEQHPLFPAKTNVHFLQIHSSRSLEIRVWERGAGPTLACGTGACATLVAASLLGLCDDSAEVMLPGGPLQISWPDLQGPVLMTGPAEAVFDGVLSPDLMPGNGAISSNVSVDSVQAEPQTSPDIDDSVSDSAQQDDCEQDEAQQKVMKFLKNTSLDSMLNLASESLEQRTRARFERDTR